MRALLLLLLLGCQAKPAPVTTPKPSAAVSASAAPKPPEPDYDAINARKFQAIRGCEAQGGIVAMGFGWTVVCIEGQVRSYNAESDGEVTYSSSYDHTR